jgi:hypothetical protein
MLDNTGFVWYTYYRKKRKGYIKMTKYNDNWFDVMFDEAVEELEKENEKNT